MTFHIDTSTEKPIGIVELSGRLDAENCSKLTSSFTQWLQQAAFFIFDCTKLDFIDSSGLGSIVACLRKALDNNGDLKLAVLGPKVSMVFQLTKANKLFAIFPHIAEAIQSFNSDGQA